MFKVYSQRSGRFVMKITQEKTLLKAFFPRDRHSLLTTFLKAAPVEAPHRSSPARN